MNEASADRARNESDARYHAFVQTTSDVVYRMSADGKVMIGLEGRNFVAHDKIPNPIWLAEIERINGSVGVESAGANGSRFWI